jgi:MFS family permease
VPDGAATVAQTPTTPEPARPGRLILYGLASLMLGLTQGLNNNLITANLQAAQGHFSATMNEAVWLSAAYTATNVTATLLLFKFRAQFGLRLFAKLGLSLMVVLSLAHLLTSDLHTAVALRAVAGFAGAPLSTLAFLYMLEHLPAQHKLSVGLALGLLGGQLAVPLARLLSPHLLDLGLWHHLDTAELAMSLVCLAIVLLLPLVSPPRSQAFDRVDAVSLPLLVVGMGLITVVLSLGRYYWWTEAPWLGLCLAAGIGMLAIVVVIELNRARPVINLHWLTSYDMLVFAGSMLVARFVLAVQTTGTIGFFQNLGLLNEHMADLFWVTLAATAAGYVAVAFVNKPQNAPAIHAVALVLIGIGAWLESHSTNLTRPHDVFLSQALIAFGGSIFLPAAMSWSLAHVLRTGPQNLTSYLAVFLASQNLGGLFGSAGLGSLVTVREKFHSSHIVESLTLADPLVAQRIQQYGASHARELGDTTLRNGEGALMLGQVATREAYVLAYNDLFLVVAASSVVILVLLFLHVLVERFRANAVPGQAKAA